MLLKIPLLLLLSVGTPFAATASSLHDLPQDRTQIVRSVRYQKFAGLKVDEIVRNLGDLGVLVRAETPLDRIQVESARLALTQLLLEKGKRGYRVIARVRDVSPQAVALTFTAVRD